MALVTVDRATWQKVLACPPKVVNGKTYYFGWHPRKGNLPTRILVHTTNGRMHSSFESECKYLTFTAKDVGAHYLVAKDGRVVRMLNPRTEVAWHAGACTTGWDNNTAIGIEMHYTPGESVSLDQIVACGNLILDLCAVYPIGELRTHLMGHRHVAIHTKGPLRGKLGRKIDPSNMTDMFFHGWRDDLARRRIDLGI